MKFTKKILKVILCIAISVFITINSSLVLADDFSDTLRARASKETAAATSDFVKSSPATLQENPATEGLLFDPGNKIADRYGLKPVEIERQRRAPEEVLDLLRDAEEKDIKLEIIMHLRGVDGPGSSLDLPEFQIRLTEKGATAVEQIPSTPTIASEFTVRVSFGLAKDENTIEYVAEDYNITEDNPYALKVTDGPGKVVGIKLIDKTMPDSSTQKRTQSGQRDAPAYIFANVFGLRGIKITCEAISPMALAGGMESSNAFNVALYCAASMLSGENRTLADAFVDMTVAECVDVPGYKDSGILGGLTGGQGHLSSILGGAYLHTWQLGKEGTYGSFSRKFLEEDDLSFIEEHMALAQAGKEYLNGKPVDDRTAALINYMWTVLLREKDLEGLKLHKEKLGLAAKYVRALQEKDMQTVVETVNRYVDIRDELCRLWAKRVVEDGKHDWLWGLEEKDKRIIASYNLSQSQQRLAAQTSILDTRALNNLKRLHADRISLYTDTAKDLIKEGRKRGIAIMPLGAGGPDANLAGMSPKGRKYLGAFFNDVGMPQLTEEQAKDIIRGTGILKGYMPFKIGREPIQFKGFRELGLTLPAFPAKVAYDQTTGEYKQSIDAVANDSSNVAQAIAQSA